MRRVWHFAQDFLPHGTTELGKNKKAIIMQNNGDTKRVFNVETDQGIVQVRGIGSFHKTLPHDHFGEVCPIAFDALVEATEGDGVGFADVPKGSDNAAALTNPQGGLAADRLTHHPASYSMPPAPTVLSLTTGAEMTELYWMALLRDVPLNKLEDHALTKIAAGELDNLFNCAIADKKDAGHLKPGTDVPGSAKKKSEITSKNIFRLGMPGEDIGPMVSQFFVRPAAFGTQTIDQKQLPYKQGLDFLTTFEGWLTAQKTGKDSNNQAYPNSNEYSSGNFETNPRYISTMRDLARFVNKDALHQAYFNAALILLSGEARWTDGNPYGDCGRLTNRQAGFGVLGGPHILALVSEVATRALKIVWNQKWQVHLRLRPEAYGGLVHMQTLGVNGKKRGYGLPDFVAHTDAAKLIMKQKEEGSLLLPMAFTPGSPTHPAYGAGHATVAGACVTILKAYFKTIETVGGEARPIPFCRLLERDRPYGSKTPITAYGTGCLDANPEGELDRFPLGKDIADQLTIEGELNKLAQNVAMGRSMGGVHWRTDNSRSLVLGEAIAAEILAGITLDANEKPFFEFRSFARDENGQPKSILIRQGRIIVNGQLYDTHTSAL